MPRSDKFSVYLMKCCKGKDLGSSSIGDFVRDSVKLFGDTQELSSRYLYKNGKIIFEEMFNKICTVST